MVDIKLGRRFLQVSDKVIPVLLLLETNKVHAGSRDVLFRVLEIIEKSVLSPNDALLHVSRRVRETFHGTSLATEKTVQVGADFVGLASTDGVAQCTTSLEDSSTLASVTCSVRHCEST